MCQIKFVGLHFVQLWSMNEYCEEHIKKIFENAIELIVTNRLDKDPNDVLQRSNVPESVLEIVIPKGGQAVRMEQSKSIIKTTMLKSILARSQV